MPRDDTNQIVTPELNFPKGGGTIQGLTEAASSGGMLGTSTLVIPLPISPARSFNPDVALAYSSAAGNGPFGLGFYVSMSAIARRTSKGVPSYTDSDEFLAPNGEVLVAVSTTKALANENDYQIRRYRPRLEANFSKIEFWQNTTKDDSFWRVYQADGTQHIFGKNSTARIYDPKNPVKILRWLLEESVAVNGEHVLYLYKPEDSEGVDLTNPVEQARTHTAGRYLKQIRYANVEGSATPYLLMETLPGAEDFIADLVFDYGEHEAEGDKAPSYQEKYKWWLRQDSFSDYTGGFEVRTHRLCRQVLMFHTIKAVLDKQIVASLELEYAESPIVTQLEAAYQRGFANNALEQACLPPIEFNYQGFSFNAGNFEDFQAFSDLPGVNGGLYQLVDLYGEGLPGVLYRDGTSFLYRAPQRAEDSDDPNAISYGEWKALPTPVGHSAQSALMDLTGDGRLDWITALPGMAGFFSMDSCKNWQQFIPFSAFPTEFSHPRAYLANMMGAGLSDLVLIGPSSVRLYANQRDKGFSPPIEVDYDAKDNGTLPSANPSETEVVAFTDILGSGQQHLVRIRYNEMVCWPNLGRGEFGKPFKLADLPFSYTDFSARRVFLADVDGSGATDLLYVEQTGIQIFLNQSGNSFAAPYRLNFPDGIVYDNLAQLSFADIWGNGSACLLLTMTHPKPKHWVYDFNAGKKSYLLTEVNNNYGLNTCLSYRSSAQEWLDEKKLNPNACSQLPFPVLLLSSLAHQDEISHNQFRQSFFYRQGYYDPIEREFLGFAYVGHYDSETFSQLTKEEEKINFSPPLLTKVWYHTGSAAIDISDYYSGDDQAIKLAADRWIDQNNQVIDPQDPELRHEFYRALRGTTLRQELFSVDKDNKIQDPFTISSFRYQVRVEQEKGQAAYPVLFTSPLEQVSYQYDQTPLDPRCDQQITMTVDAYGTVIESVALNYPRRGALNEEDPYFDVEQFALRLQRSFLEPIHLDKGDQWRLGLPYQSRSEVTVFPLPIPQEWQGPLSYEKLAGENGLLSQLGIGDIIAWNYVHYYSPTTKKALPPGQATPEGLLAQVFSADIEEKLLKKVLSEIPGSDIQDETTLEKNLISKGGYISLIHKLDSKLPTYYWVPSDKPVYLPIQNFFNLSAQQDPWGNTTQYKYDNNAYLNEIIDPLGATLLATYDYTRLKIVKLVDANNVVQEVRYDPLGRVLVSTFYGEEDGQAVGFDPIANYQLSAMTLDEIIKSPDNFIQNMATAYFYDPFSWMGEISMKNLSPLANKGSAEALFKELQQKGFITARGRVKAKARWLKNTVLSLDSVPSINLQDIVEVLPRFPAHAATFSSDQYTTRAAQDSTDETAIRQIRMNVVYGDGFGRQLQAKQRVTPGCSYVADEKGGLLVENGALVKQEAQERWTVSERIDVNNKALPVRKYQAYFINTYQYVQDTALQKYGFYDRLFYDALGRALRIVNAAGFLQRYYYHPWFLRYEDENDTLAEVLEAGFF